MEWYTITVLALLGANVLAVFYGIGRPRKALTAGDAFAILALNSLMAWAIVAGSA